VIFCEGIAGLTYVGSVSMKSIGYGAPFKLLPVSAELVAPKKEAITIRKMSLLVKDPTVSVNTMELLVDYRKDGRLNLQKENARSFEKDVAQKRYSPFVAWSKGVIDIDALLSFIEGTDIEDTYKLEIEGIKRCKIETKIKDKYMNVYPNTVINYIAKLASLQNFKKIMNEAGVYIETVDDVDDIVDITESITPMKEEDITDILKSKVASKIQNKIILPKQTLIDKLQQKLMPTSHPKIGYRAEPEKELYEPWLNKKNLDVINNQQPLGRPINNRIENVQVENRKNEQENVSDDYAIISKYKGYEPNNMF